jgi:DNA-binding NtrC family response regulator
MRFLPGAMDVLVSYNYPGNVRELRNTIERLVILCEGDAIDAESVRLSLPQSTPKVVSGFRPNVAFRVLVEEAERSILSAAIRFHEGSMAKAAKSLDLERSHLYKKARLLGLRDNKADDEDSGP